MIFAIDHIVFAATREQRASIAQQLEGQGFAAESFALDFADSGVASESWSYRSGGFVELVSERDGEQGPARWFDEAPRVIGLGFASDAFAADTAWSAQDGAWTMDETHPMADGSTLRIHAAGPHEHESDFYVFVMDRADGALEFAARPQAPRLDRITLEGADALLWRERLSRWLDVPVVDGTLRLGDAELAFAIGERPGVRASLRFAGRLPEPLRIPLSAGAIEVGVDAAVGS